MDMDDRRARAVRRQRLAGDLLRRDRDVRADACGVAAAGERATDDDGSGHSVSPPSTTIVCLRHHRARAGEEHNYFGDVLRGATPFSNSAASAESPLRSSARLRSTAYPPPRRDGVHAHLRRECARKFFSETDDARLVRAVSHAAALRVQPGDGGEVHDRAARGAQGSAAAFVQRNRPAGSR